MTIIFSASGRHDMPECMSETGKERNAGPTLYTVERCISDILSRPYEFSPSSDAHEDLLTLHIQFSYRSKANNPLWSPHT